MNEQPIVFLIDDDLAARESLATMVTAVGMTAKSYASAEEFLADLTREQWGCVVADVRMGGMSGLQLLDRFQKESISLPVVLISGFADIPTAVHAMRCGAVTFLEKPCTEEELFGAVSKALARHQHRRRDDAHRAELRARLARLSPEEREVMRAMVAGTPNKAIASQLQIGLRTVELRRAKVMKKMEAGSLAELIRLSIDAEEPDSPK